MNAAIIGLSASVLTILIIGLQKRCDKNIVYGLILMGIGFLYIGYTWTAIETAIINFFQASIFMLLAYYGIKRSVWFLVVGYFLHGILDLAYSSFANPDLLPPDYDWFCFTYDFVVGFYLLIINYKTIHISIHD